MVTGCTKSSAFWSPIDSQPTKVLLFRPFTPPIDAKLLYDSEANTFNAKLFTSLSNEFGGQTNNFGWLSDVWLMLDIGTMIGRAWALSRSDPVKENPVKLQKNYKEFPFFSYPSHQIRCQRCADAVGTCTVMTTDSVVGSVKQNSVEKDRKNLFYWI